MSWEQREGQRYYYRARKVAGRVVKDYVGAGPMAELAAKQDVTDRADRAATSAARRAVRAEMNRVDADLDAFATSLEPLTRAGLLLAGYHRHHGGEWRKRRDG